MKRKCFRCGLNDFRRINRRGFMEREVLARLGLFPWECVTCRRRRFFFNEGKGTFERRKRVSPLEPSGPADL